MDTMVFLGEVVSGFRAGRPGGNPLLATYADPLSDSFLEPLCLHALSFIRCQEGASELELAGVWFTFFTLTLGGRPSLATTLIEAGLLDEAVAALQQSSPTDWITFRTPTGILAGSICTLAWVLSTVSLPNKTQLLLDKGFIEVAISGLKAFELRGVSKLHEANVVGVFCCITMLAALDLTAHEAKPIVALCEGIPSALRFMLEHKLDHVQAFGMSTNGACSAVCALAFGKQEGGDFAFDQQMIDGSVAESLRTFLELWLPSSRSCRRSTSDRSCTSASPTSTRCSSSSAAIWSRC